MTLNERALRELEIPLDPHRIATMEVQGRSVRYLEAHDVIRALNDVFGAGSWGFELVGQPWVVESGEQGIKKTPYQVIAVLGRLTVDGCPPITDIGTNTRQGTGSAGLEMAIKGAASDAIKRCARLYGDRFGLVLYDKDVTMRDIQAEWSEATGHDAPTTQQEARQPAKTAPPAPAVGMLTMTEAAEMIAATKEQGVKLSDLAPVLQHEVTAENWRTLVYDWLHEENQVWFRGRSEPRTMQVLAALAKQELAGGL